MVVLKNNKGISEVNGWKFFYHGWEPYSFNQETPMSAGWQHENVWNCKSIRDALNAANL